MYSLLVLFLSLPLNLWRQKQGIGVNKLNILLKYYERQILSTKMLRWIQWICLQIKYLTYLVLINDPDRAHPTSQISWINHNNEVADASSKLRSYSQNWKFSYRPQKWTIKPNIQCTSVWTERWHSKSNLMTFLFFFMVIDTQL